MAWARVAVTNENWGPIKRSTIEAFDLSNPDRPVATADTDNQGMALFLSLPDDKQYFFKPRVTRASGAYGDRQQYGSINIQILAHSAMQCIDAYVESSGQWGTDKTIQAAITRLASTSGQVNIFIADGTYTEALTISSTTAHYLLRGCGERMTSWPAGTAAFSGTPLLAVINGGSSSALTVTGSKNVACVGLELKNSSASATVAPNNASHNLSLQECYVHNDGSGDAIASTTGPLQLRLERVSLKGANAINLPTATTTLSITGCWLEGRVHGQATTGFAYVLDSFIAASNATEVLNIKFGTAKFHGCTILQASSGNGIVLSGPNTVEITNCELTGTGSATTAIKANADVVATIANTAPGIWTNGVDINASAKVVLRGLVYTSVTNHVITAPPFLIGAMVYRSSAQTIATATLTKVQFDTEIKDPDGKFDNATNYNYTAQTYGYHQVNANVLWDVPGATANLAAIYVYVNGAIKLRGDSDTLSTTAGQYKNLGVSGLVLLAPGDTVDIRVYQDSGGNVNLRADDAGCTRFDIHLVQQ